MSSISSDHGDRLYWLGRYAERAFITIKSLERLYDKTIDKDEFHYRKYLECLGLTDTYGGFREFFKSFIYDEKNPSSIRYSLERAYDNGIVLREEITTDGLSFLQLALDSLTKSETSSGSMSVNLLPLQDIIYSFWGCISDKVYDTEKLSLIETGKYLERTEMYVRLKYRPDMICKEFKRLCDTLYIIPKNTPYRYNTKELSTLVEIIGVDGKCENRRYEVLNALGRVFAPVK